MWACIRSALYLRQAESIGTADLAQPSPLTKVVVARLTLPRHSLSLNQKFSSTQFCPLPGVHLSLLSHLLPSGLESDKPVITTIAPSGSSGFASSCCYTSPRAYFWSAPLRWEPQRHNGACSTCRLRQMNVQ